MNKKDDSLEDYSKVEVLPAETAKELADKIGPDNLKEVESVLVSRQIVMGGPLPVSSEFAAYEAVLSGAAREILDMAKNEQAHRQKMSKLIDMNVIRLI